MKTRSQLIRGYLNKTLNEKDKQDALNNKIVMAEVARIQKENMQKANTHKQKRRKING